MHEITKLIRIHNTEGLLAAGYCCHMNDIYERRPTHFQFLMTCSAVSTTNQQSENKQSPTGVCSAAEREDGGDTCRV